MNRKSVLSSLAVIAALMLPLAAAAQIAPDKPVRTTDEPVYKWRAYAGLGYTSLNQVNNSRYGLMGVTVAGTRDFGRFFGITAQGSYFKWATSTGNPGSPNVSQVLAGPELHFQLLDRWTAFGHVLLGGEHSGGEDQRPDISFAGGGGGGLAYQMSPRVSIRLWGDGIAQSFTVRGATAQNAYSTHMTHNSQASIGLAYSF